MKMTHRQIELTEASAAIIADSGIERLTIKTLAEKVGVSQAAIYRHFPSKSSILKHMILYLSDRLATNIQTFSRQAGNALEVLEKIILGQFKFFSDHHEFVAVIFNEDAFINNSELSETVLDLMKMKRSFLIKHIQKGQKEQTIRDDMKADDLAHILMGGLRLLILKWKLNDYSFDLIKKGRQYWKYSKKIIKKFP